MIDRIMRITPVPECVAVLEEALRESRPDGTLAAARLAVETLIARGLAPLSLLDERPVAGPSAERDGVPGDLVEMRAAQALLVALRNPQALLTAEALLREGLAGTPGIYAGLRTWSTLCHDEGSSDRGRYLPDRRRSVGFDYVRVELKLASWWINSTRDTERKFHEPGPMIFSCADQIAGGPPWVRALYETGFGLWCWRNDLGAPEWVLVVRDGEGFPWPEFESMQARSP